MHTVRLTQAEFDALPEYSKSLPTNLSYGKTWKRQTPDGWLMGKVVLQGKTGIRWYEIIIDEKKYG